MVLSRPATVSAEQKSLSAEMITRYGRLSDSPDDLKRKYREVAARYHRTLTLKSQEMIGRMRTMYREGRSEICSGIEDLTGRLVATGWRGDKDAGEIFDIDALGGGEYHCNPSPVGTDNSGYGRSNGICPRET